jgi:hypothetical protein
MLHIQSFETAYDYLNATEAWLNQQPVKNIGIIAPCRQLIAQQLPNSEAAFANLLFNNNIIATAAKPGPKIILSASEPNIKGINLLANYFNQLPVNPVGIMAETTLAKAFINEYFKSVKRTRVIYLQQLSVLQNITMPQGQMKIADIDDLDCVLTMNSGFFDSVDLFPIKPKSQIEQETIALIKAKKVFLWMLDKTPRCMAAIIRENQYVNFIGHVFTPLEYRNNGFAYGVMHALCKHILDSGISYCGLFTDYGNPISNHIYKKLGFEVLDEYSDIELM